VDLIAINLEWRPFRYTSFRSARERMPADLVERNGRAHAADVPILA
jgi:hypothetical protein